MGTGGCKARVAFRTLGGNRVENRLGHAEITLASGRRGATVTTVLISVVSMTPAPWRRDHATQARPRPR
jgi:hypothetical protein